MASQLGVDLSAPSHGHDEFSMKGLPGDYRRVLHRPSDLRFRLVRYSDPNQELAVNDMDALIAADRARAAGKGAQAAAAEEEGPSTAEGTDTVLGEVISHAALPISCLGSSVRQSSSSPLQGPMMALLLKFTLPASCYATMLIRELLKSTTNKEAHAALTAAMLSRAEDAPESAAGEEDPEQEGEAFLTGEV